MLLGAGSNSLLLYQIDDIFSRERPIWQDESGGDDSWRYGQVSVSGVAEHQVKRDSLYLTMGLEQQTVTWSYKPTMPNGKLRCETSKPKKIQALLVRVPVMEAVAFFCYPGWRILYHACDRLLQKIRFQKVSRLGVIGNECVFVHPTHMIAHV